MRVFEALPALLMSHRTEHVFGMLGKTNVQWVAEGVRSGAFDFIGTRHEETSVHAATGYSRVSGRVGTCTVTRGPGFANAVNGLISAAKSHVPLLMIVGESPTAEEPGAFTEQNIDQRGLAALMDTGFRHVAQPEELEQALWECLEAAYWNGRPQILSLNNEMSTDEVVLSGVIPSGSNEPTVPDSSSVRCVVDALETSVQPLLLAGQGAVLSDAQGSLTRLADLVGADVATTLRAHRFFSGHQRDLGLCGTWSVPLVRERLASTDLVLAFGASLNPKTTYDDQIFPKAKIVQCEIDPNQKFRASSPELGLLGDADLTAKALVTEWLSRGLPPREASGPVLGFLERKSSMLVPPIGDKASQGLDPRQVCAAIDDKLPANRIVVTDSGRTVGIVSALVDASSARSWLVGQGWFSIGLGVGTAIGACVAAPEKTVALMCGDAGFMMALGALDTLRVENYNLKVIVLNDRQLGSEVRHLDALGLPLDVARQDLPDIPRIAEIFGGVGEVIRTTAELETLSLAEPGLQMVDARIDPEVDPNISFH